ncbi:MAG TPA: class I SAM-dependent methyltransferase [Chloroflexota bacterium]|nr:class I SAM-dependent methyltransferase [Chloroflexota bacterium]
MALSAPRLPRRGDYGVDAPAVPLGLGTAGLALAAAAWGAARARARVVVPFLAAGGLSMLGSAAIYLHTSRRGKLAVWAELLAGLGLRGDERVLDVGCGRGAVLLMAAELLPRGRAVGLDLWRARDQSGNDPVATRRNAAREGVADRAALVTGDMRAVPFADGAFDVVLSSLAVHNLPDPADRARAIDEMVRVLRPGGRLLIADLTAAERRRGERGRPVRPTDAYAARLAAVGMIDVSQRGLGWRLWYGGPWVATRLVTARKAPRP